MDQREPDQSSFDYTLIHHTTYVTLIFLITKIQAKTMMQQSFSKRMTTLNNSSFWKKRTV